MHLLIAAEESATQLIAELDEAFPDPKPRPAHGLLIEADFAIPRGSALSPLVFARQLIPNARSVSAESIRGWATRVVDAVAGVLPDEQNWRLHVEPHYGLHTAHHIGARAWHSRTRSGSPEPGGKRAQPHPVPELAPNADAGRHRCHLVRDTVLELLQKKRRHLLRRLEAEPVQFRDESSLVQVLMTAPDTGYVSVAPAPMPREQRRLISPFPQGEVPIASDKTAPSRAFAKLVEAELRLGRGIGRGERCVDLGAAPGSWTNVAVSRGAEVIAIDRSPVREDLMRHPGVRFEQGDAFKFQPPHPVDWLLCDVIGAPERTADLLLAWLRRGWCRQFVVTIKLGDAPGEPVLQRLKRELPQLAPDFFLTRLCANKKEVCAFGAAA